MKYDFDISKDRNEYPNEKWGKDTLVDVFGTDEVLPLWVADMDFIAPDELIKVMKKRAEHGIYGYAYKPDEHHNTLINWFKSRHQWVIKKDNIIYSPNVVSAVAILIETITEIEDAVVVITPVYPPLTNIVKESGRELITTSLIKKNDRYEIDFKDLEEKAKLSKTKVLIMCNPHNPVGRVWSKEELVKIGQICLDNNIKIVSDDIHADVVFKGYKYIPIANLSKEVANITMTCLSPSKTFNAAGVATGATIIENNEIRDEVDKFIKRFHINNDNVFAIEAFTALYGSCGNWYEEMLEYIESNYDYMKSYISENIPKAKVVESEGTYLVWVDLTELNMDAKELQKYIIEKGRLGLNFGHWFGYEGAGYVRINIACQRQIIEKALKRLEKICK